MKNKMKISKCLIKRGIFYWTGYMAYRWNNLAPGLYCFNYHRIGFANSTEYDPGVFSCDPLYFEKHVEFFRDNFEVIDIHRLVEIIENKEVLKIPTAMITFDDGYADNYEFAFPVLKKLEVPAVFFLPTAYIDSNKISWWDEIAWLINQSKKLELHFDTHLFNIDSKLNKKTAIKDILKCVKNRESIAMEDSIKELREITGCSFQDSPEQGSLFMTWDQVNEMLESGMCMGSHTHNHIIMSHYSRSEQLEEVLTSKQIIERKTGESIRTLSYPVGKSYTYNDISKDVLKEAGYVVGFNFISGYNKNVAETPFDIYRFAIDRNCLSSDIKYTVLTTADMSKNSK